jgi:dTDP-glucose 4,6-dehydratase
MQMAKLLVTGGAGFIGTNYVRARAAAHPDVPIVVLDAMTYSAKRANIDDLANVVIVEGDIRDEALVTQLLRNHGIDTLVHFAAESHVDRSISGPDIFIDSNIVGTHSLLKAARAVWLDGGSGTPHRFHHISTDEVFGSLGAADPAFHEETPYAPNSPYSASKAASDHLVRAYHHTYGLQTTMTNCSNNYGPYQFTEKLIPLFVINALTGKNLPVYGDGMNVRDWLYVDDHCRAIDLVLGGGRVGETYNVGGGEELPNMTVIKTICSTVDALFAGDAGLATRFPDAPAAQGRSTDTLITYVTDRAGHDRRYAIDCRKLESELGYAPAYDFAGGLASTIRWYVDNAGWWGHQTA